MDVHGEPARGVQARQHGCDMRGLRQPAGPVCAEGELWGGVSAVVDGEGGGAVWRGRGV